MNFEEEIAKEIRNSVLKEIKNNNFLHLQYDRKKILPEGIMEDLWSSVNWKEVIENVRPKIQNQICNSIIGSMETEIKTDVKKILSVKGVREKIRIEIYPNIIKILDEEK